MWQEFFIEKHVKGPQYWPIASEYGSERLFDGRSNLDWYYDTYESGLFHIYNDKERRPFSLRLYEDYKYFSEDSDRTLRMSFWEKYIQPGWDKESVAAIDGNKIYSEKVPIVFPERGFNPCPDHSYGFGELVFKESKSSFSKIQTELFADRSTTGYGIFGMEPRPIDQICGVFQNNNKIYFPLYEGYYEKAYNRDASVNIIGGVDLNGAEGWLPRGVVPDDFVISHVTKKGKLDYLVSLTEIKEPGDIVSEDRLRILRERSKFVDEVFYRHGNDPSYNKYGREYSFQNVGHDICINKPQVPELQGLFGTEKIINQLQPMYFGNWLYEVTMGFAAVFVIVTVVWMIYHHIGKAKHFMDVGIWDPDYKYSHPVDHRTWDFKALDHCVREEIRIRLLVDYMLMLWQYYSIEMDGVLKYGQSGWIEWFSLYFDHSGLNIFL